MQVPKKKKVLKKIYYFASVHLNKKMRKRWRHVLSTEKYFFLFLFYIFFCAPFLLFCVLTLWLKRTKEKVKFFAEVRRYEQITWRFQAHKSPPVSFVNFFLKICFSFLFFQFFQKVNWIINGLGSWVWVNEL